MDILLPTPKDQSFSSVDNDASSMTRREAQKILVPVAFGGHQMTIEPPKAPVIDSAKKMDQSKHTEHDEISPISIKQVFPEEQQTHFLSLSEAQAAATAAEKELSKAKQELHEVKIALKSFKPGKDFPNPKKTEERLSTAQEKEQVAKTLSQEANEKLRSIKELNDKVQEVATWAQERHSKTNESAAKKYSAWANTRVQLMKGNKSLEENLAKKGLSISKDWTIDEAIADWELVKEEPWAQDDPQAAYQVSITHKETGNAPTEKKSQKQLNRQVPWPDQEKSQEALSSETLRESLAYLSKPSFVDEKLEQPSPTSSLLEPSWYSEEYSEDGKYRICTDYDGHQFHFPTDNSPESSGCIVS